MAIDGVFLNYLVNEIKPQLINTRINKVITINEWDCEFILSHKQKLLINLNPDHPHIRMTNTEYLNSINPLSIFLKHHIESGIITDLVQYNNDRIITLIIERSDELGYLRKYQIHLELTGRSCNLIITDEEDIILEALKKGFLNDGRIIQTKVKYVYPLSNKINPYLNPNGLIENIYEGVSKTLFNEFVFMQNITNVIRRKPNPVIITTNSKTGFYVFDLIHIEGKRIFFSSISEMLDYYFLETMNINTQNNDQKKLKNLINREIIKLTTKLGKQLNELKEAESNLELEKIGNILAANIHLVKPYQEEITVFNFYDNNDITIKLNTKIPPKENINYYFNKYKKAKRSLTLISETIEKTKLDIAYYQTLLTQSEDIKPGDLKEILVEVGVTKAQKRPSKPTILKYTDYHGNSIWVGKNNIQNNYLTHTLANKNDYFFHVLDYPGSHVIFRGQLDDEAIILAANIAAYYSKAKGKVNVDYTLVRYVKKVKGQLGSFVTYTNQKSVLARGDIEYIEKHTTLDK